MKKKKIKIIINITFLIISIITFLFICYSLFLYKKVATIYRILVILIILYFFIILFYNQVKSIKNNKNKQFLISLILIIILNIFNVCAYYYLNKIYQTINNYSKNENNYSSSLITYDLSLKNYKDLTRKKIGIIKENKSLIDIEGYTIPTEIINKLNLKDKNEIIYYDSTHDLLHALKDNEIHAAFFSSNYIEMFSSLEGFENIESETKVLYSTSKKIKIDESETNKKYKSLTEPFNMLFIGIDSSTDGVTSGYNADVLLLLSFNPKTLNATLTSIPRDTYIKTSCSNGKYRRINTTTWGSSSSCAVSTVENLFNVDIDYYAKINFKGIVDLVDSVGGIDIDVDYSFCEQNSSRKWGDNTVYVKKGFNHLNGEQALALSRNRHKPNDGSSAGAMMNKYCPTYNEGSRNDYVRGKHQMKVIMGIIKSATKLRDPNQAINIMEKISKNFQTNIESEDIFSLYDLGSSLMISDSSNLINIKRLQLSNKNMYGSIYDSSSKSYPAVSVPYQESIDYIKKEISSILNNSNTNIIKEISFDINKPYEDNITGSGNYKTINISTLKDLSSMTYDEIVNYTNEHDLKLNIIDYDTNEELNITSYDNYYFYNQKEHKDTIINELDSITIYVKKRI